MKLLVCIIGYNRYGTIVRNLEILNGKPNVDVIISLDFSENQEDIINHIKSSYIYSSNVEIIERKKKLGLKNHVLTCCDLILEREEYDYIVLLEDDIELSEFFDGYLQESLNVVCESVAGVSLYSYKVDEAYLNDFIASEDGYDNYYLKFPSSWGQAYSRHQWISFRNWYDVSDKYYFSKEIPDYIRNWPETSWKKHFVKYLVSENKFFLYPRISLTSNPGMDGENHNSIGNIFSVPLLNGEKKWNLSSLSKSKSIYCQWFGMPHVGGNKVSLMGLSKSMYKNKPLGVRCYLYLLLRAIESKIIK